MEFDIYSRPTEGLMVKLKHVIRAVPPFSTPAVRLHPREEGKPSKTKEFDEVIHISRARSIVGEILVWFVELQYSLGKRPDDYICEHGYTAVANAFASAARAAGVGDRTLYELRHGGASDDGGAGTPLAEIQKRGRWKTYSSVTRYSKSGLLQESRAQLSEHVLRFLLTCEANLFHFISIQTAPTLPGN